MSPFEKVIIAGLLTAYVILGIAGSITALHY